MLLGTENLACLIHVMRKMGEYMEEGKRTRQKNENA